ncbi:MAG: trimeric intracellular cation channel family protein [Eubacteriales bacterium]
MDFISYFFSVTEIIGIVAAAISGSMLAVTCSFDLFGVLFCGILTSLGGGIIRDILIGHLPPRSFHNAIFLSAALVTSLAVYLIFRIIHRRFTPGKDKLHRLFLLSDALGLASFSIGGVQIGLASDYSGNAFLCIFLGMTTAIGGGILRDIITARRPLVLRKEIYATASLIGCGIYYLMARTRIDNFIAVPLCMFIIVLIRIVSIKYHWNEPEKVKKGETEITAGNNESREDKNV